MLSRPYRTRAGRVSERDLAQDQHVQRVLQQLDSVGLILALIREAETNCFLGLGKNFLTLFKNEKPGLDHFCIAIEDFKAEAVMDQLNRQGLKPRRPSGTDRIYFPDPDEIEVQVSAVDHHA